MTALMWAIKRKLENVASRLIARGASLNDEAKVSCYDTFNQHKLTLISRTESQLSVSP